jgi:hypothetical protein
MHTSKPTLTIPSDWRRSDAATKSLELKRDYDIIAVRMAFGSLSRSAPPPSENARICLTAPMRVQRV